MTSLKVGRDAESSSPVRRQSAPSQTHPDSSPNQSKNKLANFAHDDTPARQRELETQGQRVRARVEGQTDKDANDARSLQFTLKSKGAVGVKADGNALGVDIGARVGHKASVPGPNHSQISRGENLPSKGPLNVQGDGDHGRGPGHTEARSSPLAKVATLSNPQSKTESALDFHVNRDAGNQRSSQIGGNSEGRVGVKFDRGDLGIDIQARLGHNTLADEGSHSQISHGQSRTTEVQRNVQGGRELSGREPARAEAHSSREARSETSFNPRGRTDSPVSFHENRDAGNERSSQIGNSEDRVGVKFDRGDFGINIQARLGHNTSADEGSRSQISRGPSHSNEVPRNVQGDREIYGSERDRGEVHGSTQSRSETPFNPRSRSDAQLSFHEDRDGGHGRSAHFSSTQSRSETPFNPRSRSDELVSFHEDRDEGHGRSAHLSSTQGRSETSFNTQNSTRSSVDFRANADVIRSGRLEGEIPRHIQRNVETTLGQRQVESAFPFNRTNNINHLLAEVLTVVREEARSLGYGPKSNAAPEILGLTYRHIEKLIYRLSEGVEDGGRAERIARQTFADAVGLIRLGEHFSLLEKTGGEPVRRAYQAVIAFLLNEREPEAMRLRLVAELLRDLGTGAFRYPWEMEGPFPLTGRALIVSEMIALMRTLDAIEKFAEGLRAYPEAGISGDRLNLLLSGIVQGETAEALAQALLDSGPTLPGLAGRLEIPRLVNALGGLLTDAEGWPLLSADGKPLKVGELLWLSTLANSAVDWGVDRFSTRLSPLLIHGFDAIYSVIGLDGRSLSLPRFMAIQSQINASEFEWVFGKAPFSEGWIRSMIELLKDSVSFDHNILGEILEESLNSGRFHLAVMRGTVEDGRAVSGSFSFVPTYNLGLSLSPSLC